MKHLDVPEPQTLSASYLIPRADVRSKSAQARLAAYGGSVPSR